jgi:uncharacterized protein YkwD
VRGSLLRAASWPYGGLDPAVLSRALDEAVDAHRRHLGLSELRRHPALAAAACQHSTRMRNLGFFDHADPYDGSSCHDRLDAIDPRRWALVAENLAAGQWTAEQIVQAWLESAGHRANLELADVTHVGSGVVVGGVFHLYATQLYATRDGRAALAAGWRWIASR